VPERGGGDPRSGKGYRILITAEELRDGVARLGKELSQAYGDGVVLVAVLKGSVPFLADLVRAMSVSPVIDFMAISSYAPDTGRVRIVKDVDTDLQNRDVVVVEDIVDTGLTLTYLLGELGRRWPRSIAACTLLDKAVRRIVPVPLRFRGFEIGDEFVVGYGLDHAERHRNLGFIVATHPDALSGDAPESLDGLYGG